MHKLHLVEIYFPFETTFSTAGRVELKIVVLGLLQLVPLGFKVLSTTTTLLDITLVVPDLFAGLYNSESFC